MPAHAYKWILISLLVKVKLLLNALWIIVVSFEKLFFSFVLNNAWTLFFVRILVTISVITVWKVDFLWVIPDIELNFMDMNQS